MNKEDIKKLGCEVKFIEEAGVHVRQLSFIETKTVLEKADGQSRMDSDLSAVIAGVCDEHGTLLLSEDDREWLEKKPFAWIDKVANEIVRFSSSLTQAKKN